MTAVDSLLDQPSWLSPSVALRPEPFGAMAHHFGNRKLTFLKRPEPVSAVRGLERHDDVWSGRVVCPIDPVGDVYSCPFAIHDCFLAANLFEFCRGGCMAATSFTGLPMDGPDPEDVKEYGEAALARERTVPAPSRDHWRRPLIRNEPGLLQLGRREDAAAPPVSPCAEIPLAGFRP